MRRSTVRFRQAAPGESPGHSPSRDGWPGLFRARKSAEQPAEQPSATAPECVVDTGGCFPRHLGCDMRVGVERDADLRVAENLQSPVIMVDAAGSRGQIVCVATSPPGLGPSSSAPRRDESHAGAGTRAASASSTEGGKPCGERHRRTIRALRIPGTDERFVS